MNWIRKVVLLVILISWSSEVSSQSENKTVYIYQDGNVLVNESRGVTFSRGITEYELSGLPEYFDFESLMIQLNGRVHELRWTMPKSRQWLENLESIVGQQITLEHTSGSRITGDLVHVKSGSVVIRLSDDTQTLVHNLDNYTITASSWDLTTQKSSVTAVLEPTRAGTQQISVSYFTPGLNWNNRYMLILSEDDKIASLSGDTHIRNTSDQDFEQVAIRLVAGELNRKEEAIVSGYDVRLRGVSSINASTDFSNEISSSAFGDLKLFTVEGRHSIDTGDRVRIPLFSVDGIQAQKRYKYRSTDRNHEFPQSGLVQVHYDIQNSSKNKLGQPIPSGVVALYRLNQGVPVLIGEDAIDMIARDGMISVNSGAAFDILLKETTINQNRVSEKVSEHTVEVVIQNRKNESVVIELERFLTPNQRIIRSGQPFEQQSARQYVAELTVPAGADLRVEFTIRTER